MHYMATRCSTDVHSVHNKIINLIIFMYILSHHDVIV